MKTKITTTTIALTLLALSTINSPLSTALAQGTAFTYQGQLQNNGSPANGTYDLTFTLYNASSGGIPLGGTVTNSATGVTNGLFITTLNFGSGVFNGTSYWLQLGVRTNGGASFTSLSPRQQLTPTPYAIFAENAGGVNNASISATQLNAGTPASGQVLEYNGSSLQWTSLSGTSGAWSLTGNAGTLPGTNFLGTTDDEPLELWVDGARAFRLEPGGNVIGGTGNSVDPSVPGSATIAGGTGNTVAANSGNAPTIGGGQFNVVSNSESTVGGGEYNKALATAAVVGGGYGNIASGEAAMVPGGAQSTAAGSYSFAAGEFAQAEHAGAFVWADAEGSVFSSTTTNQFNVRANGGVRFVTGGAGLTIDGVQVGAGGGGGGGSTNGWSLAGNAGTSPSTNFVGTTDSASLAFRVDNSQALLLEPNSGGADVVGGSLNSIPSSFSASTIAGGTQNSIGAGFATIAGGTQNTNNSVAGTIGGGTLNTASGFYATVPGGIGNQASGYSSFAAGDSAYAANNGAFVWADASSGTPFTSSLNNQFSVRAYGGVRFVTGGAGMTVDGVQVGPGGGGGSNANLTISMIQTTNSGYASSALGSQNTAGGNYATVAGGANNISGGNSATVGGGAANSASAGWATVGGGSGNTASGVVATIPGGEGNTAAGQGSFAAGVSASANDNNSFVWSDGSRAAASQGADTFSILATGGIYLYTTTAGTDVVLDNTGNFDFGTTTRQMLNLYSSTYGIGVQTDTEYFRTGGSGGFAWYQGGVHNNSQNNPGGGTTLMTLDDSGDLTTEGGITADGYWVEASGGGAEAAIGGIDSSMFVGSFNPSVTSISFANMGNSFAPMNIQCLNIQCTNIQCCSITIEGGCDLAEPFPISTREDDAPQGAVMVIDEKNPGHLKLSDQPYDTRVAGVISGANGVNPGIQMQQKGTLDGGKNVSLTGRVYVQAEASNGAIRPGDLLTTSATPGRAMKVTDHARAQGAILGKAMTGLNEGQGMVLVLVTLQ